jgi:cytochrome b subunit of formate dehydrogenase
MGLIRWVISPWGQSVPSHAAWVLVWVALIAAIFFAVAHTLYIALVAPTRKSKPAIVPPGVPERVPRHSLLARLFHWIMAAAMIALLFSAFLPRVGVRFDWVEFHWIAGLVLTVSILFHIVHATVYMDFWAIWPDRADVRDSINRLKLFFGKPASKPGRFAKYPLENKLYHLVVMLAGLAVIVTGLFMMKRVNSIFTPRNPYLFHDMTWGLMYALHGLAGVAFIALTVVHVYFGLRPEKLPITKSMLFGWMSRDFYLAKYDPARWKVEPPKASSDAD